MRIEFLLLNLLIGFSDMGIDNAESILYPNTIFQDDHKYVVQALVIKRLSDSKYSVKLSSDSSIVAEVYGKAKNAFYRIKAGDSVMIRLDPQNIRTARILYKSSYR